MPTEITASNRFGNMSTFQGKTQIIVTEKKITIQRKIKLKYAQIPISQILSPNCTLCTIMRVKRAWETVNKSGYQITNNRVQLNILPSKVCPK